MGGPRISSNIGRVTIFGHLLFDELSASGLAAQNATSFAVALGGGADFWVSRHIGLRAMQADYLDNRNTATTQSGNALSGPAGNFRIAAGVVFRFGLELEGLPFRHRHHRQTPMPRPVDRPDPEDYIIL